MTLKHDCIHFPGDKPCSFHKESKIKCGNCPHYRQRAKRILIIKLDAMGDVLRTTSILKPLKNKYPDYEIVWMTKSESKEIFINNDYISLILPWEEPWAHAFISNQAFDIVINLDSAPKSSLAAAIANAPRKFGFVLSEKGSVLPLNDSSAVWLEMGAFDDVKKLNTKTYQRLMLDILEIADVAEYPIIINLTDAERKYARRFAEQNGISSSDILIGLNTGAGERWKMKKWTESGYEALIEMLSKFSDIKILLYGGPSEASRNEALARGNPNVIDTGSNNSLRSFFALLSLSDVVVTGDTLALHAAAALGKQVIALFGPTSNTEIDIYGKGEKIFPEMDCLCCYLPDCDVPVKCMERIPHTQVFEAVMRSVEKIRNQPARRNG